MDTETIVVTKEMIERFEGKANSYKRKITDLFEVEYPTTRGWKQRLIGSRISLANWKKLTAQKELF